MIQGDQATSRVCRRTWQYFSYDTGFGGTKNTKLRCLGYLAPIHYLRKATCGRIILSLRNVLRGYSMNRKGITFPCYAIIPPFWNGNPYSVLLYMGHCSMFLFCTRLQSRDYFGPDVDFEFLSADGTFKVLG